MYVSGTAGRDRKRASVQADSYDEAVRLWSAFRSRAAEGLTRPSPETPTLRDFIADFFPCGRNGTSVVGVSFGHTCYRGHESTMGLIAVTPFVSLLSVTTTHPRVRRISLVSTVGVSS